MKERKSVKKLLFCIVLTIVSITMMLFIPVKQALVFEYQNTGNILAYIPFLHENAFQTKYTHSIHLSDVVESYDVTKSGEIKQYELIYEDFAIGMPANALEGETFEQKEGKYFISMNRVFPSFDLRVGKVRANHRVIYNNKEYELSNFIEPGTWVRIKIKKMNLLQLLKGVNILER